VTPAGIVTRHLPPQVQLRRLWLASSCNVSRKTTDEVTDVGQIGWQELTRTECFALLAGQHLGRIVLVDDLGPAAYPVNFVLDGHTILFRTDEGTKLDAAVRGARIGFEIDGTDEATRTGWSVLVRAEAVEVTDPDELAHARQLPLYPWAPGAKSHYVRVLPAGVTGRRITVPDDAPCHWWG
jgi:uncharacterized protein